PDGYSIKISGQYEYMERVKEKLSFAVPLTVFLIFLLLYISTRSYMKTFIIMLAMPFSLIGVAWILLILEYNISVGVWAGIIALLGIDAETGAFMLMYIDMEYEKMKAKKQLNSIQDLKIAIHNGAVKRLRPKLMTVLTTFIGLLPIMLSQSHEVGADVMKRIAAPMVGGILTSFLTELMVYPAVFFLWKKHIIYKDGL
ncbi:MAG: efflux RND transporter permease subunit, partial [bacterium]|nr:efflux RND transporter permease subunit [bacterium]